MMSLFVAAVWRHGPQDQLGRLLVFPLPIPAPAGGGAPNPIELRLITDRFQYCVMWPRATYYAVLLPLYHIDSMQINLVACLLLLSTFGWLGSRVVSVPDSGSEEHGFDRSRDAVE